MSDDTLDNLAEQLVQEAEAMTLADKPVAPKAEAKNDTAVEETTTKA